MYNACRGTDKEENANLGYLEISDHELFNERGREGIQRTNLHIWKDISTLAP